MRINLNRRQWIGGTAAIAASATIAPNAYSASDIKKRDKPFRFCLNTSTIRTPDGKPRALRESIEIVGKAGYDGIEPWIGEIDDYVSGGGSLEDARKKIQDQGLTVDSAIGFCKWIVDDDQERAAALEQLKKDMEKVRSIGGTRIAAPPVGATNNPNMSLVDASRRFHAVVELGQQMGVKAELELWGFSKFLHSLGELAYVAVECGHPDAIVLPDVYHIYKGGSDFAGLKFLNGKSIEVLHMNDYPDITRDKIQDADRVYPGNGVAPLNRILDLLVDAGFDGTFSLELFNRDYWKQDPQVVANTGLRKMQECIAAWQST
ncbi:MAG: sugar phosphate isomerase/epimerase [Planctomycetales bacterium]|nr:sugar phosphate isomerase/epimerase [Planctomycetales bacterium]